MLALQTGNRKSRPERYFCRLLPERGAVDLTVDIELSASGLTTQCSTKKQSSIYQKRAGLVKSQAADTYRC